MKTCEDASILSNILYETEKRTFPYFEQEIISLFVKVTAPKAILFAGNIDTFISFQIELPIPLPSL